MSASTTETDLILDRLVERHGHPFSEELGVDLGHDTPSALFRWLCAALLMSARMSHNIALEAARALSDAGLTTAQAMAESRWEDRVEILDASGYARFDESAARMLGDAAQLVCDDYDGDLRNLRAASDRDPGRERALFKRVKGIGDVGADIFFRELQAVWSEHYPVMDELARKAATRLGVPDTAETLADRVGRDRFVPILAALVRAELGGIDRADLLNRSDRGGS